MKQQLFIKLALPLVLGTAIKCYPQIQRELGLFSNKGFDRPEDIDHDEITGAERLLNDILRSDIVSSRTQMDEYNNHMANSYHPLKLHVVVDETDYNNLRSTASGRGKYNLIINKYIPMMVQLVSELFQVTEQPKVKFGSYGCDDIYIPDKIRNTEYKADYILYLKTMRGDNILGRAGPCLLHTTTNRPFAGRMWLNDHYVVDDERAFEDYFTTVMHEMLHALGFMGSLVEKFVDPKNGFKPIPLSQSYKRIGYKDYLISPIVLQKARDHFACNSLDKIPFEDRGHEKRGNKISGHWECSSVGADLMCSIDTESMLITSLTLAYFEASGWYKVDYRRASQWHYGYKQGCAFVEGRNSNNPFKCTPDPNAKKCNVELFLKARCVNDKDYGGYVYTGTDEARDDCRRANQKANNRATQIRADESYGVGSRCFAGYTAKPGWSYSDGTPVAVKSFCFKSRCEKTSTGQKVLFETDDNGQKKTFSCDTTGEKVYVDGANSQNYVECPNVEIFCHFEALKCTNECSFNGRCTELGTCQCYAGWGEKDCSVKGGKNYNDDFTRTTNNNNGGSTTNNGNTNNGNTNNGTTNNGNTNNGNTNNGNTNNGNTNTGNTNNGNTNNGNTNTGNTNTGNTNNGNTNTGGNPLANSPPLPYGWPYGTIPDDFPPGTQGF